MIKILAIDDNPDNLISIKALISEAFPNAQIFTTLSGEKGLELAVAENPDVILLDIVMPVMDGFEVCKKLKTDLKLSDIPVVFVTAIKGDKESRIRALECGAEAFLAKPIDESELTAQIRAMVKIKNANIDKRNEKERLAALVEEKTCELNKTYKTTLNLLDDLRKENEARNRSEEELRISEDKFKYVFDHSPVGKSITLISGEINVNKAFCDMLGYSQGELVQKRWQEITHPEDIELTQNEIDILTSGKNESSRFVKRYIHKNGKIVWVDLYSSLRRDKDNKPLYLMSTLSDITEWKKSEERLRESEMRSRSTFDQSPVGSVIVGLDKRFIKCNAAFCKFLGYSEEELIGKTISEITYPDDVEIGMPEMKLLVEGKENTTTVQKRYLSKEGSVVWGEVAISLGRDANSNPIYFLPIIQDINERVKVEVALRESEEKYRLLHENTGIAIGYYKPDGTVISYNRIAANNMNGKPEDFVGKSIFEIFPKEEAKFYFNRIKKATLSDESTVYEDLISLPSGDFYFLSTFSKIIDANNNISGIQIISQDITASKIAEEALRKSEEKLRTVFDTMEEGIALNEFIFDENNEIIDYRILEINVAYERISGYNKEQVVGQLATQLYQMSSENINQFWKQNLNNIRPIKVEVFNEQIKRWMYVTSSHPVDNKFVTSFFDITDHKRLTDELVKAKEKAEESDRLKSSFLANMSHEIRTPMNSIMGFASLMPEEDSKELMYNYARIIVRSSEQLLHVIDDIVLYSRLQTKLLSLKTTLFDAQNLLTDVQTLFNLPEYHKGVKLIIDENIIEPILILSDYEKLIQIFTNLISNAFKYTYKGTITIGLTRQKDQITFYVKDTGMGIPQNELDKIFERFYRGSNVNKGVLSGTGLGLSIVHELMDLLGGKIWAESIEGMGSTFYFTIPGKEMTLRK